MSNYQEIEYTCPYCKKTFQLQVYDTVTASQDEDLRDRCVSGDIFRHTCPHCHTDFMLQNELLYADSEHKFLIYVSANEPNENMKALVAPLKANHYTIRRCATIQEFTEKIQILEDGVNDVIVELAKYDSFIEYLDNRKGNPEDITFIGYQGVNDDVMKIQIRMGDKGLSFLIPLAGMEEELKQTPEIQKEMEKDFACINQDWIIHLFGNLKGQA